MLLLWMHPINGEGAHFFRKPSFANMVLPLWYCSNHQCHYLMLVMVMVGGQRQIISYHNVKYVKGEIFVNWYWRPLEKTSAMLHQNGEVGLYNWKAYIESLKSHPSTGLGYSIVEDRKWFSIVIGWCKAKVPLRTIWSVFCNCVAGLWLVLIYVYTHTSEWLYNIAGILEKIP